MKESILYKNEFILLREIFEIDFNRNIVLNQYNSSLYKETIQSQLSLINKIEIIINTLNQAI